jgi:hypothetical protein
MMGGLKPLCRWLGPWMGFWLDDGGFEASVQCTLYLPDPGIHHQYVKLDISFIFSPWNLFVFLPANNARDYIAERMTAFYEKLDMHYRPG